MPRRAACATPAMKATGAARISGQGVAATNTARTANQSRRDQPRQAAAMTIVTGRGSTTAEPVARRTNGAFAVCAACDQTDNAGISAGARNRRSNQLKCFPGIDRPTKRGRTTSLGRWQRFTGQSDSSMDRRHRTDDAIDRNHLSTADKQRLADARRSRPANPQCDDQAGDGRRAAHDRPTRANRVPRGPPQSPRGRCRPNT